MNNGVPKRKSERPHDATAHNHPWPQSLYLALTRKQNALRP